MDKIDEVRSFLTAVGMPKGQQSDLCCYVILAMAGIKPEMPWQNATNNWIRIHDMIQFCNTYYNTSYAENSREKFRKQALHHFRTAALVEDNGMATNSPGYRYRLTIEILHVLKSLQTLNWDETLGEFLACHDKLVDIYASKKKMEMLPVKINGADFEFSTGIHNVLQKAILEDFAPRFAPGAECLYVGDSTEKNMVNEVDKLRELELEITSHNKMPDIILYREDVRWIYFIEAVTSVGPISPKRIIEIDEISENVCAGKIFVTAFLDFRTYKKFSDKLAWGTEVWIAESPDHMIHLDGDKFLEPRNL